MVWIVRCEIGFVEQMNDVNDALRAFLAPLASVLDACDPHWAVFGSAALSLCGFDVEVHDVDILTTEDGLAAFASGLRVAAHAVRCRRARCSGLPCRVSAWMAGSWRCVRAWRCAGRDAGCLWRCRRLRSPMASVTAAGRNAGGCCSSLAVPRTCAGLTSFSEQTRTG